MSFWSTRQRFHASLFYFLKKKEQQYLIFSYIYTESGSFSVIFKNVDYLGLIIYVLINSQAPRD